MSERYKLDLSRRPRRLRRTPGIRKMVEETQLRITDLIQPLFVIDGAGDLEPIASMPGQSRYPLSKLVEACQGLYDLGIPSVALFPKLEASLKNEEGTEALNPETLILRAVREVKKAVPELMIITDVALDPYTSHGHDGLLNQDKSNVENDSTVEILAKMAVLNAEAGADIVAPSDMMDGRVGGIRGGLDSAGLEEVAIMAYSTKFSSAYYGPFRDAVGSSQAAGTTLLNKDTYQGNPANRREAITESLIDEEEGADFLMVKPAGPYLDIIRDIREHSMLPLAAYQVSGEYSQLHAAAEKGWLDLEKCRDESLLSIKRAGADLILTYFAKEMAPLLSK